MLACLRLALLTQILQRFVNIAAMVLVGKGIRPVDAKEILGEGKTGGSLIELVIEYQKKAFRRWFFVS